MEAYLVTLSALRSTPQERHLPPNTTQVMFGGLTPGRSYQLCVRTTAGGRSAESRTSGRTGGCSGPTCAAHGGVFWIISLKTTADEIDNDTEFNCEMVQVLTNICFFSGPKLNCVLQMKPKGLFPEVCLNEHGIIFMNLKKLQLLFLCFLE